MLGRLEGEIDLTSNSIRRPAAAAAASSVVTSGGLSAE